MGLDMYLTSYKKIKGFYPNVFDYIDLDEMDKRSTLYKALKPYIQEVTEMGDRKFEYLGRRVAYWRKANQIHAWFVANVQHGEDDCLSYPVSREQIRDLMGVCKLVKDSLDRSEKADRPLCVGVSFENGEMKDIMDVVNTFVNTSAAMEYLPPQQGFFFGSTEITEDYYEDIKYTISVCEDILKTFDFDKEYLLYKSSW